MTQIAARPPADSFFLYFYHWAPSWASSELFYSNKLAIKLTKYFKIQCFESRSVRCPMTEWLRLHDEFVLQDCRKMDDLEVSIFDSVSGALCFKFPVEHFSTCKSNFYRRSLDRRVGQGKSSSSNSGTINVKLLRQMSSSCKTVERWMISSASLGDYSPPQTFVSLLWAVATTATQPSSRSRFTFEGIYSR